MGIRGEVDGTTGEAVTETRAANASHRNDGTDTNRTGTTRSNPNHTGPGRTTPARNGVVPSRRTAPTGPAPVTWATVAPWMSSAPASPPTEEPEHSQPADDPSPVPFPGDHDAVLDTLDSVDRLAVDGASEALLPLARDELHRLTGGLRALLDEHRPDENGRCPVCPSGMRARRWPCQVWRTAHQHLIGENADPAGRTNRAKLNSLGVGPHGSAPQEEPSVPVHPTKIVASGDNGPGSWDTDAGRTVPADADTDVFEWPTMDFGYEVAPAQQPPTQPPALQPQATQPPVGGHLETDHTRIHRASVVSRRDRSTGAP